MHKILYTLLVLYLAQHINAQVQPNRFYTWNVDSTSLYVEPNSDSKELMKIPYGMEVEILDSVKHLKANISIGSLEGTIENFSQGGTYLLRTHWLKIKYDSLIGYSLNAEIIDLPPLIRKKGNYEFRGVKSRTNNMHKVLGDGSILTYSRTDNCVERKLEFFNKKIAQNYMLLSAWHYDENANRNISLTGFDDEKIYFASPILAKFQSPYLIWPIKGGGNKIEIGATNCN